MNEATDTPYKCADKEVRVIQVICTTLLRRGRGTDAEPIRIVTQYWSMQGDLLAERDPFLEAQR